MSDARFYLHELAGMVAAQVLTAENPALALAKFGDDLAGELEAGRLNLEGSEALRAAFRDAMGYSLRVDEPRRPSMDPQLSGRHQRHLVTERLTLRCSFGLHRWKRADDFGWLRYCERCECVQEDIEKKDLATFISDWIEGNRYVDRVDPGVRAVLARYIEQQTLWQRAHEVSP